MELAAMLCNRWSKRLFVSKLVVSKTQQFDNSLSGKDLAKVFFKGEHQDGKRFTAVGGSGYVRLGRSLRSLPRLTPPQFASPANLRFAYSGWQTVVYNRNVMRNGS
jgi:hypothetical protein